VYLHILIDEMLLVLSSKKKRMFGFYLLGSTGIVTNGVIESINFGGQVLAYARTAHKSSYISMRLHNCA